jgi:hypothetical protein
MGKALGWIHSTEKKQKTKNPPKNQNSNGFETGRPELD